MFYFLSSIVGSMVMPLNPEKKNLLRWVILFFLGNIFFLWVIGIRYISLFSYQWVPLEFSQLSKSLQWASGIFLVATYFSHLALLNLLLILLFIPGVLILYRHPRLIYFFAILIASLTAIYLYADTVIYNLYHFHLNGIILRLLENEFSAKVLGGSNEELFSIFLIMAAIFFLNTLYALLLWHYIILKNNARNITKHLFIFLGVAFYCSYMLLSYASKNDAALSEFKNMTRFIPAYDMVLNSLVKDTSKICLLTTAKKSFIYPLMQSKDKLHYPLHVIANQTSAEKYNLVLIVVDAWRADMLNTEIMPNTVKFSQQASLFNRHYSGGNATISGIISLFYSLPGTYWDSISKEHISPILINELLKNNYQMGIFASASLEKPNFRDVIFARVNAALVNQDGKTPFDRDAQITKEFKNFIQASRSNPNPFFSFVFYDGAHSYCSYPENLIPLKPVKESCNRMQYTRTGDSALYFNRYKNSLLIIDKRIEQLLDALQQNHLLKNTIVIITGDHGEEFNDNHRGFMGHASNYSVSQVRTPLIIYWPRTKPFVYEHITSHYDIVPTLMKRLFGNTNSYADYSVGMDVFDPAPRPYLIISSYLNFGIVDQRSIVSIDKEGNFSFTDKYLNPLPNTQLNLANLKFAFDDLRRFFY
jgi:membrane-anchored protein YejM (alkaline phosphatase superfamily)